MGFAEPYQAEHYAGQEGSASDWRGEVLLRTAARLVQTHAPAPDPLPDPDDYSERAVDAECILFGFLFENPGTYKALNLQGTGSVTYEGVESVLSIIKQAMGGYYSGGSASTRCYSIDVASSFAEGS